MCAEVELVEVNPENVEKFGFCFYSDPKNEKYQNKLEWFLLNHPLGLRYRVLYSKKEETVMGLIEYMPGEFSWRGIEAAGYMVIHCLMVKKEYSGQGWGSKLIEECVKETRKEGFNGVAAICTEKTWCADDRIYLKNGFELIAKAPPGLELMVRKEKEGKLPSFGNPEEKMAPYKNGIYMFYSEQCPFMSGGERFFQRKKYLQKEFNIKAEVIKLEKYEDAQSNPCAWGTYGIIVNGKVVNYVPGGSTGFLKELKKAKVIKG